MRPLRYSINVTLDGCCNHRAIPADEELHRHAVENLEHADGLLFGRVTYEMMETAFRPPARTGARPDWMEPFAPTIDAARKYVESSTLERVDWNAELVRGHLGRAVQQLKQESGKGLLAGGVKLPGSEAVARRYEPRREPSGLRAQVGRLMERGRPGIAKPQPKRPSVPLGQSPRRSVAIMLPNER